MANDDRPRGRSDRDGGPGQRRSDGSGERRPGDRRTSGAGGRRQGGPRGPRDERQGGGGPRRDWSRDRDTRPADDRTPEQRSDDQQRYDGPPIPEDVTGKELDRSVRQQLRSLPEKLAQRVARHLVAAGQLLDTDPETAYQHTLAARSRAARLAIIREACGEAAYLAGHYAEALTELKAARRMNGNHDYLALIADCERALGRPERALALAKDKAVEGLGPDTRTELLIVASGARLDLGEADMAAAMLEGKELRSNDRRPSGARLKYAYAVALLAAGRTTDATEWFHRTVAVDSESVTDAAERLMELEGLTLVDTRDEDEATDAADDTADEAGTDVDRTVD